MVYLSTSASPTIDAAKRYAVTPALAGFMAASSDAQISDFRIGIPTVKIYLSQPSKSKA
jgi:hypothetical protein